MIDITIETPTTFTQAADELSRRRQGKKTHLSTLFTWSTARCRGVVLESLQIGDTRCTSRKALQKYFERRPLPRQPGDGGVQPGVAFRCRTRLRGIATRRTQRGSSPRCERDSSALPFATQDATHDADLVTDRAGMGSQPSGALSLPADQCIVRPVVRER
jgi:hypothetical protein